MFHRLAEEGTTLLVSTHVMDEAERTDDLIMMREGRIVAMAPPEDLLDQTGATNLEDAFLRLAEAA
jgi:ABC-2 type transport system ATP-binding protein